MLSITNLAHIRTNSYTAILEPHTYHIQQRMIRISYNMMYICYANRLYVRPNSAFLEFAQFERIIIRAYSTHIWKETATLSQPKWDTKKNTNGKRQATSSCNNIQAIKWLSFIYTVKQSTTPNEQSEKKEIHGGARASERVCTSQRQRVDRMNEMSERECWCAGVWDEAFATILNMCLVDQVKTNLATTTTTTTPVTAAATLDMCWPVWRKMY